MTLLALTATGACGKEVRSGTTPVGATSMRRVGTQLMLIEHVRVPAYLIQL